MFNVEGGKSQTFVWEKSRGTSVCFLLFFFPCSISVLVLWEHTWCRCNQTQPFWMCIKNGALVTLCDHKYAWNAKDMRALDVRANFFLLSCVFSSWGFKCLFPNETQSLDCAGCLEINLYSKILSIFCLSLEILRCCKSYLVILSIYNIFTMLRSCLLIGFKGN